jgi:hypothetical protein
LDELEAKAAGVSPLASGEASPSLLAVAKNAAAKGAAGIPDMFLNAPANAWNLGQAAIGYGKEALGQPDPWLERTYLKQPNLVHQFLKDKGIIRPEDEPQTGGQRLLDTAVQGAVGMAASPASSLAGLAKNAAVGASSGLAAQATKEATGSDLAATGVGMALPFLTHALTPARAPEMNPVKAATLKEGQAAGYVIPPSTVNPSFLNNRLESIAGKAAVGQQAALRNQGITNVLANKQLGLPPETALDPEVLTAFREQKGQPYAEIAKLSPEADNALEALKQARFMRNKFQTYHDRSGDPAAYLQAEELKKTIGAVEKQLETIATAKGRPDLVAQLPEARKAIAKSYDVQRALNEGTADISAPSIARKKNVTEELATIRKMTKAFPQVMREGSRVPSPGVSGTDPMASALLGTMGYGAAGGPAGLLAAGLPLLRGPARKFVLSGPYQRFATSPGMQQPLSAAALKSLMVGRAIADRNQ